MEKYNPQFIEKKWPLDDTRGKQEYNFKAIESKWQKQWEVTGAHKAIESKDREKFYCLDFFPYPSGDGLHVGHWRGYVLSDIISRYQKLNGKNILHPMGFDAFGLPAENAAIKNNSHPKEYTQKAIKKFRKQLKQIGATYDWTREINSSDPKYYKWTQWLFLQLYKAGLAYRQKAPVNWCPNCQTVLANEQVVAGQCERCGSMVTKQERTQWFFKITQYADRLLSNLDSLDWPERTKTLQENWIGKSQGSIIAFNVLNTKFSIDVFTTRADTLCGATFMVLAPEHPIVQQITTPIYIDEVQSYIEETKKKSEIVREEVNGEKTGVFTGAYAINPITKKEIPIWIADYVLLFYGHGAVMCVPAHDKRDFDFARKFKLPIEQVISSNKKNNDTSLPFLENGVLINSLKYNGLTSIDAQQKIIIDLKKKSLADFTINYRLRDWLISRQRYWGAPIPIIHCLKCGEVPVQEKDLPVLLPDDIEFRPKGESPLKQSKKFVNTKCPKCQGPAKRETDTMDTFVDSSWYYLRFTDPNNQNRFADSNKINSWMPVDLYIGGIEHATMHLLYARFISMALHDLELVKFDNLGEPFKKLFNIGLIHHHGAKMSKSKGNVVSPDNLIIKYGSDALRGYEMFVGPVNQDSEWQTSGISGIFRLLEKIWQFSKNIDFSKETSQNNQHLLNYAIKKINEDIKNLHINTAISTLMSTYNNIDNKINIDDYKKIILIMAPIFPHLAEEIWCNLKQGKTIFASSWPEYESKYIKNNNVNIVIQVNGKLRDVIVVENNKTQKEIEKIAFTAKINKAINNQKIIRIVYIPGKVINFVVK